MLRQSGRHASCRLAGGGGGVDETQASRRRHSSLWRIKSGLTGANLVSFFLSKSRRAAIAGDAAAARSHGRNLRIACVAVLVYNFVGASDIVSTIAAIELARGVEANPLMRTVMDHYGSGWIAAKLFLQLVISAMVVWFPHRIVLGIFMFAVWTNGFIVLNNFRIALGV